MNLHWNLLPFFVFVVLALVSVSVAGGFVFGWWLS